MKKLSQQNIQHLKATSKKFLRNRIKREDKEYNPLPYKKSGASGIPTAKVAPIYFEDLRAPVKFNLQYENCEKVVEYVNLIKKIANERKNINIKMDDIDEIGIGAISMLLSVIDEIVRKGWVILKGSKPKSPNERDILEKSGFFKHINGIVDKKNQNTKNTILKTGGVVGLTVNLTGEIRKSNDTVWGTSGRNPPLRGCVYEMMRNSCDHAFKKRDSVIWHFAISHDEENGIVEFSFVDNGRGIIRSFKKGILKNFLTLFQDNGDILETAFTNGIESRTGLSWRGKGLPTIFENYKDGYFKNLVVISNDVYIDFDKNVHVKLGSQFSGTYYFWKLTRGCRKACYT